MSIEKIQYNAANSIQSLFSSSELTSHKRDVKYLLDAVQRDDKLAVFRKLDKMQSPAADKLLYALRNWLGRSYTRPIRF